MNEDRITESPSFCGIIREMAGMTLVVENNNPARDLLFFTAGVSAGGVLAAAFSRCSS